MDSRPRGQPLRLRIASWLLLPLMWMLLAPVNGLYFYMEDTDPKCFFEDLPKDTLVVGNYRAEEWLPQLEHYAVPNVEFKVRITVDEVFDHHHTVVNQLGRADGRFTFTAADAGEHRLCLTPSRAVPGGARIGGEAHGRPAGTVRINLDLAVGETSKIERTDKGKMQDLAGRVQDLKSRLEDIRKEQVFQREREAEFRDQSEITNSRVVKWTIIQLIVLGATCAWQLSHLRAFFIKQKLT